MIKNYRVQEKVWPSLLILAASIIGLMIIAAIIFWPRPASADGGVNGLEPPVFSDVAEQYLPRGGDAGGDIYPPRVAMMYLGRQDCMDGQWKVQVFGLPEARYIYVKFEGARSTLVQTFEGDTVYFCPDQSEVSRRGMIGIYSDSWMLWWGEFEWGMGYHNVGAYHTAPCQTAPFQSFVLVGSSEEDEIYPERKTLWYYSERPDLGYGALVWASFPLDYMRWGTRVWQRYWAVSVSRGWFKMYEEPPIWEETPVPTPAPTATAVPLPTITPTPMPTRRAPKLPPIPKATLPPVS